MLCGLVEPRLFVRMSRIPAHSSTARTGPPAITPVPDAAGLSSTRPAPCLPMISCGIVPPVSGISFMRRRAASTALRTASLTSFALPVAIPTCPLPSPTATSALKLKRRPPFTTFATRLIATTFSTMPSPSRWPPRSPPSRRSPPRPRPRPPRPPPPGPRGPRGAGAPRPLPQGRGPRPGPGPGPGLQEPACSRSSALPGSLDPSPLELQSPFAGAVSHRLHAPVILITAAVEHDLGDAFLLSLHGDELPDGEAPRHLALALDLHALGGVRRAGDGDATPIVHQLRVDVLGRAEHDQARPLGCAFHLLANPQVPAIAALRRGFDFPNGAHDLFRRLGRLTRLAADLLADVADAFALVGLGRPDIAQLRGHLAHQFLVHALDLQEDVVGHRDLDPLRSVVGHGMREANHQLHPDRLRLRLVPDALDLQRLRESVGDAFHHVRDERARETVQRLMTCFIRRTLDQDGAVLEAQRHLRIQRPADFALRSLDRDLVPVDLRGDALGQRHGLPADT